LWPGRRGSYPLAAVGTEVRGLNIFRATVDAPHGRPPGMAWARARIEFVPTFTQTVAVALSRLDLEQRGIDPHPRQPAPMLFQSADAMFSASDWTYGPKWDGVRVLTSI
jgi:ATP-dependent DNA ligase